MTQGPWDAPRVRQAPCRGVRGMPWAAGLMAAWCLMGGEQTHVRGESTRQRGVERGSVGACPPAQDGMPFETCESFPEFSAFDFGLQLTTGN